MFVQMMDALVPMLCGTAACVAWLWQERKIQRLCDRLEDAETIAEVYEAQAQKSEQECRRAVEKYQQARRELDDLHTDMEKVLSYDGGAGDLDG